MGLDKASGGTVEQAQQKPTARLLGVYRTNTLDQISDNSRERVRSSPAFQGMLSGTLVVDKGDVRPSSSRSTDGI